MMNFSQGDIIKISNLKDAMLVVSKNEFIKKTGVFHVCPLLENYAEGPLHIKVRGVKDTSGTAICEQLKLIDPSARVFLNMTNIRNKETSMTETLSKAWSLFDAGNYTDAETLYKECYAKIPSTDHDNYWQVLMGLIYAESFLEHFAEARTYASQLISCAIDHEEKHIEIHQAGMIERIAGAYDKAMNLFLQEEALIEKNFPDDALARSANLYEQGYVSMKLHDLPLAEKNMLSALDFAKKSNDLISIGCAYRGLGEILKASEKAEDAAVYFEKAITAFQKAGDTYGVEEVKELMSK